MNRRILVATAAVVVLLFGLLPGWPWVARPSVPRRGRFPDAIKAMKLDKPVTRPDLKSKVHKTSRPRPAARRSRPPQGGARRRRSPAAVPARRWPRASRVTRPAAARSSRASSGSTRKVRVLGQTQRATNIVALQVDASQLEALAQATRTSSRSDPVVNYQKALSETVPYIGATAVQNKGFDGKGVRVGVIDSGIDYTHVEFGGAGTAAAYEAAYGTTQRRHPQHDARRPLPDRSRRGRLRLRRRELAGRRRHRGSRPRPDRLRRARHPRRRHHRRHARRRPEGRSSSRSRSARRSTPPAPASG